MASEILTALFHVNVAGSVAVLLALCLRVPIRRHLGAIAAYATWVMVPIAMVASLVLPRLIFFEDVFGTSSAPTDLTTQPTLEPDAAVLMVSAWAAGVLIFLALFLVRQIRFSRALGRLLLEPTNPRLAYAENSNSGPVVIGILSPKIVLPADFRTRYTPAEQAVIVAHESAHVEAGDTRTNLLIAAIRCVNWFNVLIHLGARYGRIDQEFARDAAVAARFSEAMPCYARAMLKAQLAMSQTAIACRWIPRTSTLLTKRISLLSRPPASGFRRALGIPLATAFGLLVGCTAWTGHPRSAVGHTQTPTVPTELNVARPITSVHPTELPERPPGVNLFPRPESTAPEFRAGATVPREPVGFRFRLPLGGTNETALLNRSTDHEH